MIAVGLAVVLARVKRLGAKVELRAVDVRLGQVLDELRVANLSEKNVAVKIMFQIGPES